MPIETFFTTAADGKYVLVLKCRSDHHGAVKEILDFASSHGFSVNDKDIVRGPNGFYTRLKIGNPSQAMQFAKEHDLAPNFPLW